MTPCPICGAVRFATCATHGAWRVRCDKEMTCPGCQRGESTVANLLACAAIFAFCAFLFWSPRLFGQADHVHPHGAERREAR